MSEVDTETPQNNFVVAVTGHRPNKLGGYKVPNPHYDIVVNGLLEAFKDLKPGYLISGMAIGVDQWAAEIAINMDIKLVAAIPFVGQERIWPPHVQAKYQWLLSKAFAKYVISDGGYEDWKMQKRNEWMVASCHQVVAVWDGSKGGTANCIGAAVRVGKPIYYVKIPPPGMPVSEFFLQLQAQQKVKPLSYDEPFKPATKRVIEL